MHGFFYFILFKFMNILDENESRLQIWHNFNNNLCMILGSVQIIHLIDRVFILINIIDTMSSEKCHEKSACNIIQKLLDIHYLCFCKLLVLNQNNHNGLTKSGCVVHIMSVKYFVVFLCFWNNGRSGSFTRMSWQY